MEALTVYYEGREIGQVTAWQQEGRELLLQDNALGVLEGMVVEVASRDSHRAAQPALDSIRIGGLVGEIGPSGVLIQLDQSKAFDVE